MTEQIIDTDHLSIEIQNRVTQIVKDCDCKNYQLDFTLIQKKFAIRRKSKQYAFKILFEDLREKGVICEFMSTYEGKDEIVCRYKG